MIEFGRTLRAAREAKGMTTQQIADATHLMIQVVEELENEDFSRIAAPIYGRGFVKLYCEAVGIDSKALVAEFMELYNGNREPTIRRRDTRRAAHAPAPHARPASAMPPAASAMPPQPAASAPDIGGTSSAASAEFAASAYEPQMPADIPSAEEAAAAAATTPAATPFAQSPFATATGASSAGATGATPASARTDLGDEAPFTLTSETIPASTDFDDDPVPSASSYGSGYGAGARYGSGSRYAANLPREEEYVATGFSAHALEMLRRFNWRLAALVVCAIVTVCLLWAGIRTVYKMTMTPGPEKDPAPASVEPAAPGRVTPAAPATPARVTPSAPAARPAAPASGGGGAAKPPRKPITVAPLYIDGV